MYLGKGECLVRAILFYFFLNERARYYAYFIDKEEEYIRLTGKKSEKDYSLRISDSRCLAPARAQAAASLFILEKSPGADISYFLKILAFLSHQISQIIKRKETLEDHFEILYFVLAVLAQTVLFFF